MYDVMMCQAARTVYVPLLVKLSTTSDFGWTYLAVTSGSSGVGAYNIAKYSI